MCFCERRCESVEDEENRASSFFSIDSQRLSGKHNVFQHLSICLSARFLKNLHVCTHLLQRLSQKHITFTYIYLLRLPQPMRLFLACSFRRCASPFPRGPTAPISSIPHGLAQSNCITTTTFQVTSSSLLPLGPGSRAGSAQKSSERERFFRIKFE